MIDTSTKMKVATLFTPGQMEDKSDPFSFSSQVTIRATGMLEGDRVTFRLVKIKPGSPGYTCDCINVPPTPIEIEAIQTLMCPDCSEAERQPVRLTPDNPVVILDYPQNTLMYAVYEGDGIGMASVTATFDTTTKDLTQSMRGCPESCPKSDWYPAQNVRCVWNEEDAEDDEGDAPDTEEEVSAVSDGTDIEGNGNGETPEPEPEPEPEPAGLGPDEYAVEREYVNQLGQSKWVRESVEPWSPTGVTACFDNRVHVQQQTRCGDMRWKKTDTTCGYIATLPMPAGGFAFRPGFQDPTATVELRDCDGDVIGYLYPEPRADAKVEVTVDCNEETVIGYAVNGGDSAQLHAGSGKQFSRYITHVPVLEIKSIPGLKITNLPESINVDVVSAPRQAVNTFEWKGKLYALFNDGTHEELNVGADEQEPAPRMIELTFITEVPVHAVDKWTVEPVVPVELPDFEAGPNRKFLGWSVYEGSESADYPAGYNLTPRFSMTLYAVWQLNK